MSPQVTTAPPGHRARHAAEQPRVTLSLGAILVGCVVLVALAAPILTPYAPQECAGSPYEPPSRAHLLGTDDVGHDNWTLLAFGARQSLLIGAGAALIATTMAVLVGVTAALRPRGAGHLLMAAVDVLMAVPMLPLLLLIAALVQPGPAGTALVIGLLGWAVPARILRAQGLTVASSGYVSLARCFGGSTLYLLRRHVVPAIAPLVLATVVGQFGRSIGMEATLGFLGIGDPTRASWGLLLRHALDDPGIWFTTRWVWWMGPPALAIAVLLIGCTLLAIAAERRFDPRLKA